MATTRACLRRNAAFIATITCDDRPGKLFEGLQHCRSTIVVLQRRAGTVETRHWSSGYRRWASEVREFLLPLAAFTQIDESETPGGQFPKIASPLQVSTYAKMFARANSPLGLIKSKHTTGNFVFYQESAQYWIRRPLVFLITRKTVALEHRRTVGTFTLIAPVKHASFVRFSIVVSSTATILLSVIAFTSARRS